MEKGFGFDLHRYIFIDIGNKNNLYKDNNKINKKYNNNNKNKDKNNN